MKAFSTLAILAVAGSAMSAQATVIIQTGFDTTAFETPGYTGSASGTNLNGQNGWISAGSAGVTSGNRMKVNNTAGNQFAGNQYVQVDTTAWTADTTSALYRLAYAYKINLLSNAQLAANPVVHTSVAMRMQTPTGTRGEFTSINAYGRQGGTASGTFDGLGAMGIFWSGSGNTNGTPDNTSFLYIANTNSAGSGAEIIPLSSSTGWLNTWFVFDITQDYSTGMLHFSLNGVSLDSQIDTDGFVTRNFDPTVNWQESDMQAERDRPASGSSSGGAVMRFDSYLVENIPAPSSMALLGVGGLLAARRRRA